MTNISKIKKKYKQLKYQHLKKIYAVNLAKFPRNCKYNKEIRFNTTRLNICTYDIEDNTYVDLCYKTEHAEECNAFCPFKSKEKLYLEFVEDLKDEQTRATEYKDIHTLYWLQPDLRLDVLPENKKWYLSLVSWFKNIFL